MNILKREVWSQRTTRKIVVISILVLAAFWFGIDGWYFVERNWLTPMERRAALEALATIDELQEPKNLNEYQFSEGERKAKSQIADAEQKAWTTRDQHVAIELRMYLLNTVAEPRLARPDSSNQRSMREVFRQLEPESNRASLIASLHKTLD